MPPTTSENARAVLLPAFDSVTLSDATKRFLDKGGVSILLGESRAEYVNRRMDDSRRKSETAETFSRVSEDAKVRSGRLLVAVDLEMGGICRLHDLVPQFPTKDVLPTTSSDYIEDVSCRVAKAATAMKVNVFLSPVLDVLKGKNTWLQGRTWSTDPHNVARLSAAYVRGVQRAGVAATGKHFPGFGETTGDPAIEDFAINPQMLAEVEAGHAPFRAVIEAGVEMIMVGPAIVTAYDECTAALRSTKVVSKLKNELNFRGVIMADDLDSRATMRDDSLVDVAIDALNAGCHFLLLADIGNQLDEVAEGIVAAAES